MTKSEEHKIRNYLLDKKLPIDILLEVNDHFISQILDFEKEENLSFEQAFEKTKVSWKNELAVYYPWYVTIKNNAVARTRFEQGIRRKANINLMKLSIPISLILFSSIYLMAEFGSSDQFSEYFRFIFGLTNIFVFITVFYNYIFYSFAFKKDAQRFKFSIYQWAFPLVFSFGIFGMEYLKPISTLINSFKNSDFSFSFITQILVIFSLILAYLYTGIAQIKLSQTLKKIKPQLQFT